MLRGYGKIKAAGITLIILSLIQLLSVSFSLVDIVKRIKSIEESFEHPWQTISYNESKHILYQALIFGIIFIIYYAYKLCVAIYATNTSKNPQKSRALFGNAIALLILNSVYIIYNTTVLIQSSKSNPLRYIETVYLLNILIFVTDTSMIILLIVGASQNKNYQYTMNSLYGMPMYPPYPPNQPYPNQPMQPPYPPNAPYGMPGQPMPDQMQGVRCQTCGMMNPPGAIFCSGCGNKMV